MKRSQAEKLKDNELKELALTYGYTNLDGIAREGLITLLCGENVPVEPEVEPEVVAPAKGNTQVTTELEKQLKALQKKVDELEKYDIRRITENRKNLNSAKHDCEVDIARLSGELEDKQSRLKLIDEQLSELKQLAD